MATTEKEGRDAEGLAADGASFTPAISGDGRYVAFDSPADNLAPGATVTPGVSEVYVRDHASPSDPTDKAELATRFVWPLLWLP